MTDNIKPSAPPKTRTSTESDTQAKSKEAATDSSKNSTKNGTLPPLVNQKATKYASQLEQDHQHLNQMKKGNDQFATVKKRMPGLGRPTALLEEGQPKGSRLSIFIVSIMILAFLAWASLTPIKEVAIAQGQVVPSTFVKTIQHLEGGIIKHIYVEDGSEVKEGDILIQLDTASATSELEQIHARETSLRIKAERLRAFGMNEKPDFKQFSGNFQNLVEDQQSIFDMQSKNRDDQREIIQKQLNQRKASLTAQEGRVKDLEHRVSVLEKQRDVLKGLYEKHLKTGTEYRGAEDLLSEVMVELNQAKNTALESQQGIGELESRFLELDTRLRNESLIEMGNVTGEIAQLIEAKLKQQDRVKRLAITAPAAGIIKGLKNTTLQGVIQPGAEILQIVPKENLEIEAKVQPKDMGKLRSGQNVMVKVTAYDYTRYGGINGTVKAVSATTFVDDKNVPYYRVLISLKKNYLGEDPHNNHLTPGMTVQADIETDQKTLLAYLVKPVYIAVQESFRER
ncbi:MAG: HlyD family type I secretion periplasmic adaptor subunit [Alphaproteobacteria bacterium]|nr:HlyD family type I secretion periplasmic adaptor subunit [Alphaproteobacteria bacterium]